MPHIVNQPLEKGLTVDAEAPLIVAADVPPPQSHTKRSRSYPLTRGDFVSLQAQIEYICRTVEAIIANIGSAFENKAHVSPLAWPLQKKVVLDRETSSSLSKSSTRTTRSPPPS
jgi:hypothetical protein